jgi:flagellar basal body P-ring protein FlgI
MEKETIKQVPVSNGTLLTEVGSIVGIHGNGDAAVTMMTSPAFHEYLPGVGIGVGDDEITTTSNVPTKTTRLSMKRYLPS